MNFNYEIKATRSKLLEKGNREEKEERDLLERNHSLYKYILKSDYFRFTLRKALFDRSKKNSY